MTLVLAGFLFLIETVAGLSATSTISIGFVVTDFSAVFFFAVFSVVITSAGVLIVFFGFGVVVFIAILLMIKLKNSIYCLYGLILRFVNKALIIVPFNTIFLFEL